MNIATLIESGEQVVKKCIKGDGDIATVAGKEYAEWIQLCTRYLQTEYPDDPQMESFVQIGKKADGNFVKEYHKMIGILKALQSIPSHYQDKFDDLFCSVIEKICQNFNKCAKSLLNRHKEAGIIRDTLRINDEYDVQDLLYAILSMFVDDIRKEEYAPSYAGANSRVDFYLREFQTYIETKMTRDTLKDKKIGEELTVDIARYKGNCKTLICFIYDSGSHLENPYGLIHDLEQLSTEDLRIRVFVSPI